MKLKDLIIREYAGWHKNEIRPLKSQRFQDMNDGLKHELSDFGESIRNLRSVITGTTSGSDDEDYDLNAELEIFLEKTREESMDFTIIEIIKVLNPMVLTKAIFKGEIGNLVDSIRGNLIESIKSAVASQLQLHLESSMKEKCTMLSSGIGKELNEVEKQVDRLLAEELESIRRQVEREKELRRNGQRESATEIAKCQKLRQHLDQIDQHIDGEVLRFLKGGEINFAKAPIVSHDGMN